MADFAPGKWVMQWALAYMVFFLNCMDLIEFSLFHDLPFGVQLWPGKCTQRFIV